MTIRILMLLESAGAKPGPHVPAIGGVKVSIPAMNEARTSCPTSATQDFMIAKPGRRVFLVRSGHKSGIRIEIAGRPFPNVADHLTTAERTVAFRQRADIDATTRAPIKIGAIRFRSFNAPGKSPLVFADYAAISGWFSAGRHLPFCFRWQAAPGPSAERVRFIPIHVQDRKIIFERPYLIEVAAKPFVALPLPVNWMLCAYAFSPPPAGVRPKLTAFIAATIDKLGELCVGDGGLGNREWFHLNFVPVHLVVKNERAIRHAAKKKTASGYLRVT